MKRYAETFFRYWVIAIMPILVLPAAYYAVTRHQPKTLVATTKIWVDQSLASTGSGAYYNTWLTPAQNEANALSQLLQLSSFDSAVAHGSPLYLQMLSSMPNSATYLANDLARNAQPTAIGNNLISVSYTCACADWRIPQQVAESLAVTALRQTLVLDQQQTTISIDYAQSQLRRAKQGLSQSSKQLSTYMTQQGIASEDVPTQIGVDPRLATLYQQVQADEKSVASIQQQIADLKASQPAAGTTAQSGLQIVDGPTLTVISSRKTTLMLLVVCAAVGLLLGGGFVALKTRLDHSLRYPNEVPELLDLPVLAVLPYTAALAGPGRAIVPAARRDASSMHPADLRHIG